MVQNDVDNSLKRRFIFVIRFECYLPPGELNVLQVMTEDVPEDPDEEWINRNMMDQ